VKTAYWGLKQEVLQALVLIALVILVFLQSLRGTLIVALAIPLAVLAAFPGKPLRQGLHVDAQALGRASLVSSHLLECPRRVTALDLPYGRA